MPLYQNGTELDKPLGSEVQVETLPEIYPPRGVEETQGAWDARVTAWGARTRTITFIIDDGSLLGTRQTTIPIAFSATADAIQTEMEALAGLAPGDIKVTGAGRTFQYSFSGVYANRGMKTMFATVVDNNQKRHFETLVMGASENFQQRAKQEITTDAVEAAVGPNNVTNIGKPKPADIGDPARYNPDGSPNQR